MQTDRPDELTGRGLFKLILVILAIYLLAGVTLCLPRILTDDRQAHRQIMVEKFKAFAEDRE